MKCRKCGEENFGEGAHCTKCGASLQVISKQMIALSAGAGVLLLAALVVFLIVPAIQYPYQRSEECIRTGSYAEAEELYQEHFVIDDRQTRKLLGLAQDRIAQLEDEYRASSKSFDAATEELNNMQVLSFARDEVLGAKKKLCSNHLERVKEGFAASPYEYAAAMAEAGKIEAMAVLPPETVAQARTALSLGYLAAIQSGYETRKLDYETALEMLGEVTGKEVDQQKETVSIRLKALKASRDAFQLAKDYFSEGKLKDGLAKLKMVIDSDDEYVVAQSLYYEKLNELKKQVLSEADGFAKKKNYETCITVLNSLLKTYFDNKDKEISDAIAKYTKLNNAKIAAEKAKKKADAKKNQQVVVVSARSRAGFINQYIEVVIKNNSKKTIKRYEVTWFCYDAKGEFTFDSSGYAERKVRPGSTFGRGYGWETWEFDNKYMKKVIACVTFVEYTDGTVWNNPYYDYWYKDYYDKPLR